MSTSESAPKKSACGWLLTSGNPKKSSCGQALTLGSQNKKRLRPGSDAWESKTKCLRPGSDAWKSKKKRLRPGSDACKQSTACEQSERKCRHCSSQQMVLSTNGPQQMDPQQMVLSTNGPQQMVLNKWPSLSLRSRTVSVHVSARRSVDVLALTILVMMRTSTQNEWVWIPPSPEQSGPLGPYAGYTLYRPRADIPDPPARLLDPGPPLARGHASKRLEAPVYRTFKAGSPLPPPEFLAVLAFASAGGGCLACNGATTNGNTRVGHYHSSGSEPVFQKQRCWKGTKTKKEEKKHENQFRKCHFLCFPMSDDRGEGICHEGKSKKDCLRPGSDAWKS